MKPFRYWIISASAVQAKDTEIARLKESVQILNGRLQESQANKEYLRELCSAMVNHTLSDPEKLGLAFASSVDSDQAKFLNAVGAEMRSWGYANADLQVSYLFDKLNDDGRFALELFQSWAQYREENLALCELRRDPICVCGVHRSEHALCGCAEGFEERIQVAPISEPEEYDPFADDSDPAGVK